MKHMSHPETPDVIVEATEDRAITLASAGWVVVEPKADKK